MWNYLPVVAALLCVGTPTAHAGMIGWMDNAFTFRKEQKPLVAPHRNIPPKRVVQPYYPNSDHVTWSNFYTRTDLVPQDYLTSSASKVMRPRPVEPTPQQEAAQTPAQEIGGWPAIAEQAAQNARAESEGNVMIGEPGQGVGMREGTADIGRATRIGPAVNDWRSGDSNVLASRPGDYDYRGNLAAGADMAGVQIGTANAMARLEQGGEISFSTDNGGNGPYVARNAKGQVIKYAVQKGDSLSTISGQSEIYGTWKLWPLIYSANRRAIGGNPDNLTYQQRLDIPRDYTEKQAREAEARARRN